MKARRIRSATLLAVLLLVWASPWPSVRVGGIGNYDVTAWGLYDWLRVERLQPAFVWPGLSSSEPTRSVSRRGCVLTAVATIGLLGFGREWVRRIDTQVRSQQRWGLLALGTVALCWVVHVWWPTTGGANGGVEGYRFSRGLYNYADEHVQIRGYYIPTDYPTEEQIGERSFAVNWAGAAVSLAASVIGLGAAVVVARRVTRLGLPAATGGPLRVRW